MSLNIADHNRDFVCVKVNNQDKSGAKLQVHPNLDKKAWKDSSILKSAQKVLPKDVDFGVLRWRVEIKDEDELPLSGTPFGIRTECIAEGFSNLLGKRGARWLRGECAVHTAAHGHAAEQRRHHHSAAVSCWRRKGYCAKGH